jgi:hypothetical protein
MIQGVGNGTRVLMQPDSVMYAGKFQVQLDLPG